MEAAPEHNSPFDCDHIAVAGKDWRQCPRCGATAKRDHKLRIVEYTRGTHGAPRPVPAPAARE